MTTTNLTDTEADGPILDAISQHVSVHAQADNIRVVARRHPTSPAGDRSLHDQGYVYVNLEVGDLCFTVSGRWHHVVNFAERLSLAASQAGTEVPAS